MITKRNYTWLTYVPQSSLLLFILLNLIAMYLYPGNTYHNHLTNKYIFTQNFLSDLGRTHVFSGKINFFSSQLFNTSLIIAGIVFIMFYYNVKSILFLKNKKWLSYIGSWFGILGGICLAGVGLTPANLYLSYHILFANWLFRFMLFASIFYSYIIFKHPIFESKYAIGYIIFTITILFYIIISELGPSPKHSVFALTLQVVSQKIILFIFLISVYIQSLGIQKFFKYEPI